MIYGFQAPPVPYYLGSGKTVCLPGEQHPSRRDLCVFDLLLIVKGTLYIGEEDKQWELSEGQTLLLLPDRYHYATQPCYTETVFYWIHFAFEGKWNGMTEGPRDSIHSINQPWTNAYMIMLPQSTTISNPSSAYRTLQRLMEVSSNNRASSFWQEQQLLMELLAMLEGGVRGSITSPSLQLAEKTEAFLKLNYKEKLTNEQLSEALHFHPNYIVRCMKEFYRCTPMEYLHDYRLEQARMLLIKTEWSITQIAEAVGFSHTPYFSSCFKTKFGVSPLRYRKKFSN